MEKNIESWNYGINTNNLPKIISAPEYTLLFSWRVQLRASQDSVVRTRRKTKRMRFRPTSDKKTSTYLRFLGTLERRSKLRNIADRAIYAELCRGVRVGPDKLELYGLDKCQGVREKTVVNGGGEMTRKGGDGRRQDEKSMGIMFA